jgi:hypothetical protein
VFKEHYQKMVAELKDKKAKLQQELDAMPSGPRKDGQANKLRMIKVELANYIEAASR